MLFPTLKEEQEDKTLDWESSTQLIADRFSQAIAEHGPDSVAFYVSGQLLTEDYYVANKLIKGFMGSANIDSNSRLCMASSVVGHKRAFGSDTVPVCYEDLEQTELVVLVGSNLAWCHPVLFQRLRSAKQNNPDLQVIVIDPRQTETCAIADDFLQLKSGSDVALFNGLLDYLTQNGYLDHAYIEQHTTGFEQAEISAKSEREVSQITGLSSAQLERFYRTFATTEKVVTVYSQGVNQSSTGSDKVNSIINCHLATGKIGQIGMGPFSVTGQPNAMGGREVGALANTLAAHMEFDNPAHLQLVREFWKTDKLAQKPGLKAVDLFDAMAQGKIKAVWIMATNPVVSLPDTEKVKAALQACPFVVVSDCIADTETTRLADLVLPAQGWSEKSGTVTNSERRISRQRRVMASPGMAKPDWWIISQVGQKMGFEKAFNYLHEGEIFREYAQLSACGNANGERDFSLIGLTQLDDKGYSQLTPQQWPVTGLQKEIVNQRLFSDHQFFTEDRKAKFVAVSYFAPKSSTSEHYPLLLNSGRTRDHWHTMSRTGLSTRLGEHSPEPYLLIHPDTATQFGIKDKQLAKVRSETGECQARAKITKDMLPDQLFIPIHWNNTTAKSSKPCELIAPHTDGLSGQPEFKHTPVQLSACHYQSCALFISRAPVDLNEFDYWSRQKIDKGYLYRIESTLSLYELAQKVKSKLSPDGERVVSFESGQAGEQHRYITLGVEMILSALYIQASFETWEVSELITHFNQTFDANAEAAFLAKAQLSSVA